MIVTKKLTVTSIILKSRNMNYLKHKQKHEWYYFLEKYICCSVYDYDYFVPKIILIFISNWKSSIVGNIKIRPKWLLQKTILKYKWPKI